MEYGAHEYRVDIIDDLADEYAKKFGISYDAAYKFAVGVVDGTISEEDIERVVG